MSGPPKGSGSEQPPNEIVDSSTGGSGATHVVYEEMRSRLNVAWMVAQTRRKRGWSQEELAERAGTKQSRISEIESVRGNPRFDTLDRVARALGLGITLRPRSTAPKPGPAGSSGASPK